MKHINKNEYIGGYNKISGYARVACTALLALTAFMPIASYAGTPAARPLDERIIEKLDKNECPGFTAFGDVDGDKIDEIILSVDKISQASQQDAPESKLAIFYKDKITTIDSFSVYIEKLELADIDGCGNKEIIFLRRGGMKNLMEVYALKAEKKDGGDKNFKVFFKSDGVNEGKFDIIKSPEGAVTLVIGGYLAAPGAIAPHLEFSHFYAYDKTASRLKLVKKNYERPKTLSQEYEMAYLSLLENKKDDAVKRLERIIRSAKTAKSEDSADILKECETLLAKIK